jgi:hypothetical protein
VTFVEFPIIGEVSQIEIPTNEADFKVLSTTQIVQGDTSDAVKVLQKYLGIEQTGIFRTETRVALKAWQDKHFGPQYEGTTWGKLSQQKYIELHS